MHEDPGAAPAYTDLLDALPMAALLTDREGVVSDANEAACRLLGETTESLTGAELSDVLFDDIRRGVFEDVLSVVLSGGSWDGDLTVVAHHGVLQQAAFSVRPVRSGEQVSGALVVVTGTREDGVGHDRLAERLTSLARVAAELAVADSIETVAKIVVEHLADAAGATVASLSLLEDADTLSLVGIRGGREGVETRWARYSVHDQTPAGDAVREGRVLILEGQDEIRARYPDLESGADGQRSIACLPLRLGGRSVGVATMSFPGARTLAPTELEFLSLMADTCAQAVERVRVTAEAADRSAKIQFLADSSVELSSSLDYEVTLSKVARLAVPWFADWCTIALDQDGELRTLAVAHVDPRKVEMAEELQRRYPADPDSGTGSYQVLRTGRSDLIPDISEEMLTAVIEDPEHLRLLREVDMRSALAVPLKARGRVFGVVTWVAGEGGRRFGVDDLVFAEDLARRAAQAIDTARLHSELSDVAIRLQRAILPAELPTLPGWQAAASYLQAGQSDAGGDFYDVTPLPDGRLAIFLGDVMGRGVAAAAAMAQMRAAIRALVAVEPDPRTVLVALDRLFDQYDFHQLVTLVYVVLDPAQEQIVVANAGHPPPLVHRADGSVEILAGEPGLLLGAGGGERSPMTVPFFEGDLLLTFTDGLVERRGEDIEAGLGRLAEACTHADSGDLFVWLADLVLAMRDTTRDDDVAVLAVRRGEL